MSFKLSVYKVIIIILFLSIIAALILGLFNLIKEGGKHDSTKTVRALTIRIVLSFTLIAIIAGFYFFGLIGPMGD